MRLYLAQHGEAVDKDQDPERPLSARGEQDVRKVADFAARSGIDVGALLHSGKLRARQTAEILAASVRAQSAPEERPGLGPKDPVGPVLDELGGSDADTLIVGHMPFVARAVNVLIGAGDEHPAVDFRPGSLVCLERGEAGRWSIAWMVRPDVI